MCIPICRSLPNPPTNIFAMPPYTETHYCLCKQWQLCRFIAQHPSFCSFIWHSPSPSVSTVVHHNCSPCPRDDLIPNLYRYLYCPKWKLKDCSSNIIVLFFPLYLTFISLANRDLVMCRGIVGGDTRGTEGDMRLSTRDQQREAKEMMTSSWSVQTRCPHSSTPNTFYWPPFSTTPPLLWCFPYYYVYRHIAHTVSNMSIIFCLRNHLIVCTMSENIWYQSIFL